VWRVPKYGWSSLKTRRMIRYSNETILLTEDKVENAIRIAKNIRDFGTDKLDISVDYTEIIDKKSLVVTLFIKRLTESANFERNTLINIATI
jgi:hypothetical protein